MASAPPCGSRLAGVGVGRRGRCLSGVVVAPPPPFHVAAGFVGSAVARRTGRVDALASCMVVR